MADSGLEVFLANPINSLVYSFAYLGVPLREPA
jgi:hypothetical protein